MSATNSRRAKQLRLTATILGLLGAIFVTLFMRFAAVIGNFGVLATGLIILSSVATAWKWPLIGGVVLIVESLLSIVAIVVRWSSNPAEALGLAMLRSILGHFTWVFVCMVAAVPCVPLLASGVLFILSWRKERKASDSSAPPEGNCCQN